MKRMFLCIALSIIMSATLRPIVQNHPTKWPSFKRVVIWGHAPHSHTHAYIHEAFYKAFTHLGYKTYWVNDPLKFDVPLENTLFITVGRFDENIPIRSDCLYMIHNCDHPKYLPLRAQGKCIVFQVYTHSARKRNVQQLHDDCPYILYDLADTTLYMPWATDLLPHEIDAIKKKLPTVTKNNKISFVGTIWGSDQGNATEITQFRRACDEINKPFCQVGGFCSGIEDTQHKDMIMHAYMAPAIQGAWQCEHGYIPCRIFKNISYGAMGITNNPTVYDLFKHKVIYNADAYQLLYDAQTQIPHVTNDQIVELMDFVRDKHTYLNRIDDLLTFFGMVRKSKGLTS